jgi:hypothetical protein
VQTVEIGLIYSKADPRQSDAREFVIRYLAEHGVLAEVIEDDQPVPSPTLIINGFTLADQRQSIRSAGAARMFPGVEEIRKALERQLWGV